MLSFETINELTLKVTCTGSDVLFVKAGAFIAGDNCGPKNYRFEKVLLGPQQSVGQALFGQLARRVTGENIPLMKVSLNGDSVTYYANYGQHVVIYQLAQGETISVESENILAFTQDCNNADLSMIQILIKKSFIMDTTVEQMNIGGFRENSIRTVRIIGAMNRVIQDVSIKNPFMEFKISNLEEVDFMN